MEKGKKAIIGISGGIDSAVTAKLCQILGADIVLALLPYKGRGLKNAELVAQWLGEVVYYLDIGKLVDKQVREINKIMPNKLDKIDIGNIMARQRMIILYALARKLNGIVVGSSNFTEYMLGYFTLHGDGAWDENPIKNLYKTEVRELAKKLGVPKIIRDQPPSADLWEGQTDEGELGFSYRMADKVIKRILETEYKRK